MKVAIIGIGSMGGLFAWKLVHAGVEVWGVDVSAPHVARIAAEGLQIDFPDRPSEKVPMHAVSDPAAVGLADAVLVFVKGAQTAAAMTAARPMIGPDTLIVTMQNGIGNAAAIQAIYPEVRVAHGMTTLAAQVEGPGQVLASSAAKGEVSFYPTEGTPGPVDQALCAALDGEGFHATLDPGIDLRIWKKLVVNCCLNSACALLDCKVGEALGQPATMALFDRLTAEIVALAQAKGIGLTLAEAQAYLRAVGRTAAGHFPSMVADMRAKRRTEIGALNGAIVAEAERLGLKAPANAALRDLVLARQEIAIARG